VLAIAAKSVMHIDDKACELACCAPGIQAIACAAAYEDDWPLLIITPSSARFHWDHELKQWLGDQIKAKHVS
jgi:hypothetical protein